MYVGRSRKNFERIHAALCRLGNEVGARMDLGTVVPDMGISQVASEGKVLMSPSLFKKASVLASKYAPPKFNLQCPTLWQSKIIFHDRPQIA